MDGATSQYIAVYGNTVYPVKTKLLFCPMVKDDADILFSDTYLIRIGKGILEPMVQQLGCFAGAMLAQCWRNAGSWRSNLAKEGLVIARKLTDRCI